MVKENIFIKDSASNTLICCKAYKIAKGIYVHKRYIGNNNFATTGLWSISHTSGYAIIVILNIKPITLKKAIEIANKLIGLDWSKSNEYILNHEEYGKLVMELRKSL